MYVRSHALRSGPYWSSPPPKKDDGDDDEMNQYLSVACFSALADQVETKEGIFAWFGTALWAGKIP